MSHYGEKKKPFGTTNGDIEEDEDEYTLASNEDPYTLIGAIRSLESSINHHCNVLNKRLRKEKSRAEIASDTRKASRQGSLVLNKQATRAEKVIVYIRVVFLKIGEIDTLKENFAADAFVQARWREPALDGRTDLVQEHADIYSRNRFCSTSRPDFQNLEDIDWEKYWNPKLYIENNLGEPKESVWQTALFNSRGEATVYERRRVKGCFLENLELDEFPFDTQDLTLTLTSERSEVEVALEEDHSEISSINVQSFVDEQEWRLHTHVETWKRVTTRIYHNSKYKHPAISCSCRASRRPGFYIWNIFLVMLFICSLAFATFTVDREKPENRLQLSFILLLTTITFKFVVSQTLPRIPYLTYLDKYILTSMGILCGVCVWHSMVPLFMNEKVAITADRCALIILGTGYFMFHLVFFLYIYFVALKKRWKYNDLDKEHKERMKKLQNLADAQEQRPQVGILDPSRQFEPI